MTPHIRSEMAALGHCAAVFDAHAAQYAPEASIPTRAAPTVADTQ